MGCWHGRAVAQSPHFFLPLGLQIRSEALDAGLGLRHSEMSSECPKQRALTAASQHLPLVFTVLTVPQVMMVRLLQQPDLENHCGGLMSQYIKMF